MTEGDVGAALRDAMLVLLKLGAPPLLTALVVGVIVALFQAVTQINESALGFVPKVLALGAAMVLLGPFLFGTLQQYTLGVFDRIVLAGSQ